jgi:hypothetical protein
MNENGVVWIGGFPSGATAVVFSRIHGEDEDDHDRDELGPPFSGGAPRDMSNPGGGR